MRTVYGISLSVPMMLLSFEFVFSTSGVSGPLRVMPLAFAQEVAPAAKATPSVACVQNALGGERAFATVSSLHIQAVTKPSATTGSRPLEGTQEISVVFPDRYKRANVGISRNVRSPGTLSSMIGFDREATLSRPGVPDKALTMRYAREDFAQQMLMRLPGKAAGMKLAERVARDAGREQFTIDASGPAGFAATLSVNPGTCIPIALQYVTGQVTTRIELADYRLFSGIRFPTVLKTFKNGEPFEEEQVSEVELNSPKAGDYFAP